MEKHRKTDSKPDRMAYRVKRHWWRMGRAQCPHVREDPGTSRR